MNIYFWFYSYCFLLKRKLKTVKTLNKPEKLKKGEGMKHTLTPYHHSMFPIENLSGCLPLKFL